MSPQGSCFTRKLNYLRKLRYSLIHTFQVILLHVSSDSKQDEEDTPFMIDVDNTLKDVLIVLSAEGDLEITLLNPTGKN